MKFAGARGITRSRVPIIAMLALAATIGLAGCEGDDGKDGADSTVPGPIGPTGPAGPTGPIATKTPIETCGVCHGDMAIADAADIHQVTNVPAVSGIDFAVDGLNLVVSFNLTIDGEDAEDFSSITRDYRFDGTDRSDLSDAGTPAALAGGTDGEYTITITNGAAYGNSRYLFRIENPAGTRAMVVGEYPEAPDDFKVASGACENCHGQPGNGFHYGYPVKAENCTVCHNATTTTSAAGTVAAEYPWFYILGHSIHNSHNMPGGEYALLDKAGEPVTNRSGEPYVYEVTFPTYMNNCSICHAGRLETVGDSEGVNDMPVTYAGCTSCHGSMAGFGFVAGVEFGSAHLAMVESTPCGDCHKTGGVAAGKVAVTDFHNGLTTERGGIIWDGEDTSVTEGAKFDWRITGVNDDGTKLAITWTVSYANVGVNPCNATVGVGAPVFDGDDNGNISVLYSFMQGGDPILGTDGPGQAASVNTSTTNTVCAGNVATTTIEILPADRPEGATVGRIALQGKPRVVSVANASQTMQVRAKTPVFDWILGTDDQATARRGIVDTTGKCLKCHVGSLYQHGGNRVDNVDMCILCHNSASSEQFVREAMGVDASEAYDGKAGQTFEMKTMLHAIHSTGETGTGAPIVIYRNRGIYAWAGDVSQLPNWNTGEACVNGTTAGTRVFGSDPAVQNSCQPHTFHAPTYPRRLYDCAACHVDDFSVLPNQSEAVATTLNAGSSEDEVNQLDDVLEGASAAACMSCHQSSDSAVQAQLKGHAYQNGWEPAEFPEGRQTIIDAAK